jgi:hypothetical protein
MRVYFPIGQVFPGCIWVAGCDPRYQLGVLIVVELPEKACFEYTFGSFLYHGGVVKYFVEIWWPLGSDICECGAGE